MSTHAHLDTTKCLTNAPGGADAGRPFSADVATSELAHDNPAPIKMLQDPSHKDIKKWIDRPKCNSYRVSKEAKAQSVGWSWRLLFVLLLQLTEFTPTLVL